MDRLRGSGFGSVVLRDVAWGPSVETEVSDPGYSGGAQKKRAARQGDPLMESLGVSWPGPGTYGCLVATLAIATVTATVAATATAAATTVTAAATAAATTTVTATAAAAAAATVTAATATAAAATTVSWAFFTWAGFVDGQRTAHEILAVESLDDGVSTLPIGHGGERETAWAAGHFVHHNEDFAHLAVLREEITDVLFSGIEGKISDVEFVVHCLWCCRN